MYRRTPVGNNRALPLKLIPALACSKIIRCIATCTLGEVKDASEQRGSEDGSRTAWFAGKHSGGYRYDVDLEKSREVERPEGPVSHVDGTS
jgi:hypothetical protein